MALELLSFGGDSFRMRVRCSKGTYIRTLAEDLCAAVGQRAHLGGLRRTAVTPFWDHQPVDLERLQEWSGDFAEIGRASCREECVSTCRSRRSPDHEKKNIRKE